MLKKTIVYTDYNGKSITEDFYFNLTKAELIELELSEKSGLANLLQEIVASEDGQRIIETFKKIILMAYGKKSDDGRRFIKTQELRDEFSQTEAYSELFIELATDADSAAKFVKGIVPEVGAAPDALEIASVVPPKKLVAEAYVPLPVDAPAPATLPPHQATLPEKPPLPAREMTREELLQALRAKDAEVPVQKA